MKLSEIKQLTDNLSDINKWIDWLDKQPIEKLKSINPITISKLPKEFQYYLVREKLEKTHNNRYNYSQFTFDWFVINYKDKNTKIPIICPIHGEFKQSILGHLSGKGCPECGRINSIKKHRLSYQDFINKAKRVHNNRYQYPFDNNWWQENYKNHSQKVPIICPIHGEFMQSVNAHLRGEGCPECGREKSNDSKRLSYQEFIERAIRTHNNKYTYPVGKNWWDRSYNKRKDTEVTIICPIHGEFKQIIDNHLSGYGCPKCASNYSKGEEELRQFIESLGFNTTKYKDNKYEIDVFIPELNIGFEYNGIFWHSDINKPKKYHQEKSLYFANKGITLIHIWEDWWLYKNNIVKSFIRQKLGKVKNRVYARKCKVEEVDYNTAKNFLDENHIDGFAPAKLFLALKYDNTIISLISIKYWKQEDRWEIDKFANKQDFIIVGGFSKLFKHFISKYNPNWVTTFSHIDLNNIKDNVVYGKNGFKFVHITVPTYFYFNKDLIRKHRRLFQKKRLLKMADWVSEDMTEREITDKMGLIRVYNSGNFKWEWKKSYN